MVGAFFIYYKLEDIFRPGFIWTSWLFIFEAQTLAR